MRRGRTSKAVAAALAGGMLLVMPGCERMAAKFERPAEFVEPARPNDTCNSASFRLFLGKPSDALASIRIPEPYRVLSSDGPMTTDYNPARLNLLLAADGTLADLTCG